MKDERQYTWRKHRDHEIDWVAELLFWMLILCALGGLIYRVMA